MCTRIKSNYGLRLEVECRVLALVGVGGSNWFGRQCRRKLVVGVGGSNWLGRQCRYKLGNNTMLRPKKLLGSVTATKLACTRELGSVTATQQGVTRGSRASRVANPASSANKWK